MHRIGFAKPGTSVRALTGMFLLTASAHWGNAGLMSLPWSHRL